MSSLQKRPNVRRVGTSTISNSNLAGDITASKITAGKINAGGVEIGNDVGPVAGHNGISLSSSNFNNIFLKRDDGVVFFRVNGTGANSLSFDSSSSILSIAGTITATSGTIGGFTLGPTTLTASDGTYPPVFSQYASISIDSAGLIESYYENDGLISKGNFWERVRINHYLSGASGAGMVYVEGTASGSYNWRGYSSSGVITPSDIRLKTLIDENVDALALLNNIHTTLFTYNKDDKKTKKFGFIAQQAHEYLSDAVRPGGDDPDKEPWTMTNDVFIPYLVKSIQQLSKKVEHLESLVSKD